MAAGSSSAKGFGPGRGKGVGKRSPFVWEGTLGPATFEEAVYEFPVESRSDFTKENPLRGYDKRREDWSKCMHGEDYDLQMQTEGVDGGRRFYKCPRAWNSRAPENCGFAKWVDPPPLHPYQEYIYYLQHRIFDLEREVSAGYKDEEDDGNNNTARSQEALCTDSNCNCRCHHKKGPPPPPSPPPPPPPTMGGYYGEGATQFAMWRNY